MRFLRYLLAIAMVSALSGIAKADDFQMIVVDPNPPANLITPIYTNDFSFSLSACQASQLFGLSPAVYLGCFTGENLTGSVLTSLQIIIPVFDFNGQLDQPGCSPESQDVFSVISCGFTNNNQDYYVDFSGGNIPSGVGGGCNPSVDPVCNSASIFTIAEAGIPPQDFPTDIEAFANLPEPSSIMLLSTGVLSMGLLGAYRRGRAF